jgi:hypothetical protein
MTHSSRPIVIIGMQRSGTSALAGALARLGVNFGSEELLYQGDANNPQGYFEHRKATILNLRCLHTFQMHPTSFGCLPKNWKVNPQSESLRSELKDYLKIEFAHQKRWGIKQPVTSLVLPIYNDVFSELGVEPHYVLCVRSPLETMASEARLDFGGSYRVMPSLGMRAIGSWLRYTLGAAADAFGYKLSVVAYPDLLSNPADVLARLVARDDSWQPSTEQFQEAVASIKTDLRHNRVSLDELDAFPPIVKQTYLATTRFNDSNQTDWDEILALHQEFTTWTELLGDPEPAAGKLGLAWVQDGKARVTETPFQPTGDWQTVAIQVDAPPKTNLNGLLYGPPFRGWIRRSIWHVGDMKTSATLRGGLGSQLSYEAGMYRLDGVFEPNQIGLTTPGGEGLYTLELELLLETGPQVFEDAAAALARKLEACVSNFELLSAQKP